MNRNQLWECLGLGAKAILGHILKEKGDADGRNQNIQPRPLPQRAVSNPFYQNSDHRTDGHRKNNDQAGAGKDKKRVLRGKGIELTEPEEMGKERGKEKP